MPTSHPPSLRAVAAPALAFVLAAALATSPAHSQVLLRALASPNEEVSGGLGVAVAGTGDLDGDGVPDLLVGASGESPGPSPEFAGRAYAYSGATGAVIHTLVSPTEQERGIFGSAVARVPDADGDAVDELLVGAGAINSGGENRAHLFSGATGAPLHTLAAPSGLGSFGVSVAGLADVDGDGAGDLLVGSPSGPGRAYVHSGRTGARLHVLASPSPFEDGQFGYAVGGTADLDGDGVGDLIVGAYGEFFEGRAYAFSGATGALLHRLRVPPPEIGGQFGWSVAGVGDADVDGVGDVAVGAPRVVVGGFSVGRAYVFSGRTGALVRALTSPNAAEQSLGMFGDAVSATGDLDGDGTGDLVVGAADEGYGAFPRGAGRAYAFSGRTGGLLLALGSPSLYPFRFGNAVTGAGDLDGDGRGELVVGALLEGLGASGVGPGRVYVFSGVAPPALTVAAEAIIGEVEQGGHLRLLVTLTSNDDAPLTGALRLEVSGPEGIEARRLLLSEGTLGAGQTAAPLFRVAVPANAPIGEYTGVVVAESLSGASVTSAPFAFEVVAGALAAREDPGTAEAWAAELVEAGGLLVGQGAAGTGASPSATVVVPNPTSGRAAVALTLAAPSEVRLALYDVLGRAVAAVEAGVLPPGSHRLALDVSALPPGVYVWRLAAGPRTETGRLTVAR